MVGSSIYRNLKLIGYNNLIGLSSKELDLRNQKNVDDFIEGELPDVIINCAGKVGGILANNSLPYQFLLENLQIQNNLISSSVKHNVKKFIFLGSSCIYPPKAQQPFKETDLLSNYLEPTNEGYAIAKISAIKLCQAISNQFNKDYVSLIPSNLYGINDHFDLSHSHVLQALVRKFNDAVENDDKFVTLWGNGSAIREFTFVDDVARAVIFAIENILPESLYNIGSGDEISIKELAIKVQRITAFKGDIIWDETKPNGSARKLMDSSKINSLGWKHQVNLDDGLKKTYKWFLANKEKFN